MQHDTILILDFGSQVTQLIARRVRECHVYCEVLPGDTTDAQLRRLAAERGARLKGIILSGSHASVHTAALRAPQAVFALGLPVLGICYGMQTMALQLGGQVQAGQAGQAREFGPALLLPCADSALLRDMTDENTRQVWMNHGDQVSRLPPGFACIAATAACPIAAMADEARRLYGVQFHPEVAHTVQGAALLRRFVRDICAAHADWRMDNYIETAIARIRAQVGSRRVLLGLSGGVDSCVAAALIHRAIGNQLTCVFVDHGLLRLHEGDAVMQMMTAQLHAHVLRVDAADLFLQALQGIHDPEAKRKTIGRLFVEVFTQEAQKLPGIELLAQGTIYPDVIESGAAGGKKAVTIKSHHNVGGLPEQLGLELLEPLRPLFKDEVRALGLALGLAPAMVWRHPFPGPGLGVRILGEVKKEYADLLRRADHIFIEELRKTTDPASGKNWYELTSQAFAVFLPVKSVGVMGDGRTWEYVVALRAVQTSDFMTADWAELPHALLKRASTRIINEVPGINRVAYDISSKPPATIEWE